MMHRSEFDNNLLIICSSGKRRREQIEHLLKMPIYSTVFNRIERVYYGSNSLICGYWEKIKLRVKLLYISRQKYDVFIIGNYLSIYDRFAYYKCWQSNRQIRIVAVDDGLAATMANQQREEEIKEGRYKPEVPSAFDRLLFLSLCHGIDLVVPHSVCFFTIYQDLNYFGKDTVEVCKYQYLLSVSKHQDELDDEGCIIIAGQPMVAEKLLTRERYNYVLINYIEEMCDQYQKRVIYVPHPIERIEEQLDEQLLRLIRIERPDLPFEIWAMSKNPKRVVGLYSSVLINMHNMCPLIEVHSLYPKEIHCSSKIELACYKRVYDEIQDQGITRIYC